MTLTRVLLLPATPQGVCSLDVVVHRAAARNVRVSVEAGSTAHCSRLYSFDHPNAVRGERAGVEPGT